MAQWKKAPEKLVRTLDDSMRDRGGERRTMFGFPVYFVKGNMFYGVFEDRLFLRLAPGQIDGGRRTGTLENLEPMKGRPMKDYFLVPADVRADAAALSKLLDDAMAHAATMPPKVKKPKGPKRPAKG